MTASVNGRDVLSAELREPRIGIWLGEIDLDSEEPLSGALDLVIDDVHFMATAVRGAVEQGRYHAWIIGGKYGLSKQVSAKHYISVEGRVPLREILQEAGESLSPKTDPAVLSRRFERWSRATGTAGSALAQFATDAGVSWRMLRDGTVWLGPESWPEAKASYDIIDVIPARARMVIAPEVPSVKPGETFAGGKVSTVTTIVAQDGTRQDILFEDENVGSADRVRQQLTNTVESIVGRRLNLSNWYPARVVSQAADGTVDLLPDDPKMRGSGISRVPLRHGLPGCTVRVRPGSTVALFFEDCDAKKPAAGLWPNGSSVLEITVSADALLTLKAPAIQVQGNLSVSGAVSAGSIAASSVSAGGVELKTHKHSGVTTGAGASGPPVPLP